LGRSKPKYVRIFSLTQADLQLRIVNCAAGPASFDAELSAEGHRVISCDSLFSLSPDEIHSRIDAAYDTVVTNGRTATDEFVWREFTWPEHLGEARMAAMRRFLAGISRRGPVEPRYLDRLLPHLGFCGGEFDLAFARTCFSPTPINSPSISTSPPSRRCAGSRPRRASSRC
jgi:hypothetical protein